MKFFLIISAITISFGILAQKDRHIWFFGEGAAIDFLNDTVTVRNDGVVNTLEGCSTMCDDEGNLLFSSDGSVIFNKNGGIMFDSYGINGNFSSTNSAVSVKKPGSDYLYYVFTADIYADLAQAYGGVWYSIIDMREDYGDGDVIELNTLVLDTTTEKIGIAPHANQTDYWIIVRPFNEAAFYAYQLSANGLSTEPSISFVPTSITSGDHLGIGGIKTSLDGSLLVSANTEQDFVELYDFNTETGYLTNYKNIGTFNNDGPYGVEFSESNQFLYISTSETKKILQYNLDYSTAAEITNSGQVIMTSSKWQGALQIGPDHKIYCTQYEDWHLPVIEYPNNAGSACSYDSLKIIFSGLPTRFGLPLYIPQNKPDEQEELYYNLEMPTGFTPNGDGYNDLFLPIEFIGFEHLKIEIFNRWGDLIYTSSNLMQGWNGKYNGRISVDGTYFWVAKGRNVDGKFVRYNGYFDLRR